MSRVEGERRIARIVPVDVAPEGANSMGAAASIVTGSAIVPLD